MSKKSYIVAINSSLGGLLDLLNDRGFNYKCEDIYISPLPTYIAITVWCYPHEICEVEDIFAPYV